MMWKRTLLALTIASAVSACAGGGVETRTGGCDVFGPIHPAAGDIDVISDDLVEQLLVHNETGAALCGWEPPS